MSEPSPSVQIDQGIPPLTDAERAVADLLPIAASERAVSEVLERVPLWFHTFSLGDGVYTPGVARDHRYRLPFLPADLSGRSVLDVGTFDGFYAFLAEARGARRVVAVDNEQYRDWVQARWGIELEGGGGFRAIAQLLASRVEYARLDAFDLAQLEEEFDVVLCFGILHRVESPLGLLRVLRDCVAPGGELLLETYGLREGGPRTIEVHAPGAVYRGDDFVYWGFGPGAIEGLASHAAFDEVEVLATPTIDRHPRIAMRLGVSG